ncbi:MAG: sel1 repeat family protein [Rhodoferax sp.]|nr:sel1 repeat family protein [Rhodoferax sp.]
MTSRWFYAVPLILWTTMVSAALVDGEEEDSLPSFEVKDHYTPDLLDWIIQARRGDADAQYKLGDIFSYGQGVPKDPKEALKWYRLAAGQGDPAVQYRLAVKCANGQGVPQDEKEALRWYRLAGVQGNVQSQYNLGVIYASGQGGPKDPKEAVKWFRLAAHQGFANAQFNLAVMYVKGQGVAAPDRVIALALYNLAGAKDSNLEKASAATRSKLMEKMSPGEIDEAKTLMRQMAKPKNLIDALDSYLKSQQYFDNFIQSQ